MSATYISGPYTSGRLLREIRAIEDWIAEELRARGPITNPVDQRDMARRVEEASHGRNTVMFDDVGYPSIMVWIPAMRLSDLVSGWPNDVHPAFVVRGAVKPGFWIGKYPARFVGSGSTLRGFSLRMQDPGNSINADNARLAFTQKGSGWHGATNAEYALLALLCKKNGFWPRGNNYYGRDYSRQSEVGHPTLRYLSGSTWYVGRTATGSGPVAWSHDGTPFGVFDLNGNVWEWAYGLRLLDGEINIIQDNDAADGATDLSRASAAWKAIMPDGSLVAPGTAGTLKFDSQNPLTDDGVTHMQGAPILRTSLLNPAPATWGDGYYDYNYATFESLTADAGVTIPNLLRCLAIFPVDAAHGGDGCWVRTYGERFAIRGGYWVIAGDAGVFALTLIDPRSYVNWNIGARPAFVA